MIMETRKVLNSNNFQVTLYIAADFCSANVLEETQVIFVSSFLVNFST